MHHSHSVTVMMKSLVITNPTLSSLLYLLSAAQLLSSPKTNLLSILRTVNTGGAGHDEHYQIYTHSLLTGVPLLFHPKNLTLGGRPRTYFLHMSRE